MRTILGFFFCVLLVGGAAGQIRFGDASLRIPAGWQHTERTVGAQNALIVIPPDFGKPDRFMIAILPSRALQGADFNRMFEQAIQSGLSPGERVVERGELQRRSAPAGFDVLIQRLTVEDASHHRTPRVFCAANPNGRLEVLMAMADSAETLRRYQPDFDAILSSFTFGEIAPAPPATSSQTPPVETGVNATAITRGLWVNAGPKVLVKDIALDEVDRTIYVAAADMVNPQNGGIFASSDSGKTWSPLYRGNCSQVAPTGTNRIYVLDFGEQILVSDDRGRTWTKTMRPRFSGNGFTDNAAIQCIAVSPAAPMVLYAGANGMGAGLYKSTDGGRTWTRPARRPGIVVGAVENLAVDPQDANLVFASFDGAFAQSRDGGTTFFDCLKSGAGAGQASRVRSPVKVVHTGAIQIDGAFPNVVYLRARGLHPGIFRTDNGGGRWIRLATPNNAIVLSLVVHPQNPRIVYASTAGGLWASQNSGESWTPVQSGDAPKSTGGFTIPPFFNGTAFNSVVTVVHEDEPMLVDPQNGHLLHGGLGVRVLVGLRSGAP